MEGRREKLKLEIEHEILELKKKEELEKSAKTKVKMVLGCVGTWLTSKNVENL